MMPSCVRSFSTNDLTPPLAMSVETFVGGEAECAPSDHRMRSQRWVAAAQRASSAPSSSPNEPPPSWRDGVPQATLRTVERRVRRSTSAPAIATLHAAATPSSRVDKTCASRSRPSAVGFALARVSTYSISNPPPGPDPPPLLGSAASPVSRMPQRCRMGCGDDGGLRTKDSKKRSDRGMANGE